jgi:hypothetical protein
MNIYEYNILLMMSNSESLINGCEKYTNDIEEELKTFEAVPEPYVLVPEYNEDVKKIVPTYIFYRTVSINPQAVKNKILKLNQLESKLDTALEAASKGANSQVSNVILFPSNPYYYGILKNKIAQLKSKICLHQTKYQLHLLDARKYSKLNNYPEN